MFSISAYAESHNNETNSITFTKENGEWTINSTFPVTKTEMEMFVETINNEQMTKPYAGYTAIKLTKHSEMEWTASGKITEMPKPSKTFLINEDNSAFFLKTVYNGTNSVSSDSPVNSLIKLHTWSDKTPYNEMISVSVQNTGAWNAIIRFDEYMDVKSLVPAFPDSMGSAGSSPSNAFAALYRFVNADSILISPPVMIEKINENEYITYVFLFDNIKTNTITHFESKSYESKLYYENEPNLAEELRKMNMLMQIFLLVLVLNITLTIILLINYFINKNVKTANEI